MFMLYNTLALNESHIYRGVEQLVARRAHNPEVVGSSPSPATKKSLRSFWNGEIFLVV